VLRPPSIDADATVNILDKIAATHGFPEFIRCDHGPNRQKR
jgi:hypothetical protein